jgi:integrase
MQSHFASKEITEGMAHDWVRGLINAERAPNTVALTWLAAAKTVYNWAKKQRLCVNNPFKDVKVTVPRKATNRETKAFMPEEYQTILRAALATNQTTKPFSAAKRWVPWLCAYTGARAGEITQLRGIDIERRGDGYVLRLTPEAGSIKTNKVRVVPLHEHIIAQGFFAFVEKRGKGPLFYDAVKATSDRDETNPRRPRAVKTREQLGAWVRDLGVDDPELRPNHAWRHTFKQIAECHGISERVNDAITGHAAATVGRTCGAPTVEDTARELKKFPRYET